MDVFEKTAKKLMKKLGLSIKLYRKNKEKYNLKYWLGIEPTKNDFEYILGCFCVYVSRNQALVKEDRSLEETVYWLYQSQPDFFNGLSANFRYLFSKLVRNFKEMGHDRFFIWLAKNKNCLEKLYVARKALCS